MTMRGEILAVSARQLGQLAMPDFCKRCFWNQLRYGKGAWPYQIPMPGIFASLDSFTKRVVHGWIDRHGSAPPWFPPDFSGPASYVDRLSSKSFYLDDTGSGIRLTGVPDDILRFPDRELIPDYKTARFTPGQDQLRPLYEVQLNAYALIRTASAGSRLALTRAGLLYFEPLTDLDLAEFEAATTEDGFRLAFQATYVPVELDPERIVLPLLALAREIHDLASPPPGRPGCENCARLARLAQLAAN